MYCRKVDRRFSRLAKTEMISREEKGEEGNEKKKMCMYGNLEIRSPDGHSVAVMGFLCTKKECVTRQHHWEQPYLTCIPT